MTMPYLFAILAGMFKALRDRDEWLVALTWYGNWKWYQAWSKTKRYLLVFPLDVWHNMDVLALTCAYAAGRGRLDESVIHFLAIALTTKTLFYEFLLLKHPIEGLRMWIRKMRYGN